VKRVVRVELDPNAKQGDLSAALEPVADRLLKLYAAARAAFRTAKLQQDDGAAKAGQDEMDALALFKGDATAFVRLYTFLSQIFDYGNTAIEKRAIFFRGLVPLLDFGREREGIDLSNVVLTHHALKQRPAPPMVLGGESTPLPPIEAAAAVSCASGNRLTSPRSSRSSTTCSTANSRIRTSWCT
jgi:type I restriction enzyme R subunit